jgi:branched-chain amino acid aminotransferase
LSFLKPKFIWKNGNLVPWEDATAHLSCHGLHYGTGVFEGIRCYKTEAGPAVFRLREHVERWFRSANVYNITLPYSMEQILQAVIQVISANGFEACYIRPIAFLGPSMLRVRPIDTSVEVAILCWPTAQYFNGDTLNGGIRATISTWSKFPSRSIPAHAKACGQYINSVLAINEASAKGYDEAILLDHDGFLSEGTGENLFLVKNNRLFTNDHSSPILMGITRETVLTLAEDLRIQATVGPMKLHQLHEADEAFFSGTAVEITPIASVDDLSVGDGKRGPLTTALQKLFFETIAGKKPKYRDWLTLVGDTRPH